MAEPSKELLDQPPKPSILESLLLGSKDHRTAGARAQSVVDGEKGIKPITTQVPKSQVLGKVKDFLSVMAEANEKLEISAQGSSRANYDIEVLDGNEKEYIEMDLLLGVADLNTAEAVAAAEASMGTLHPSVSSESSEDCSETEDESDEESGDDNGNQKKPIQKPNKRSKIVELN